MSRGLPLGVWKDGSRFAVPHERLLWTAVFALVLTMQWPMLKGVYYRALNVAPPPTQIEWLTDVDAALVEARRTHKQVFVDFSADWCPPCIAMKHDVWPDAQVARAVREGYVPLLIDMDRDSSTAERYGVRAIPTIMVLDTEGQVVRRATFLSKGGMLRFLASGGSD